MENKELILEECSAVEFMAHFVGLSILHPGGYNTTDELADLCEVDENTKLVDIGCGKGTSSIYLAKIHGCKVVGIDKSEERIEEAIEAVKKKGLEDRVEFRLGDVHKLSFDNETFDVAITQAALVYFDKEKVVKEAVRVLKKGGRFGAAELSWKKKPTESLLNDTISILKEDCIRNALTFEEWKKFFADMGLKNIKTADIQMWNISHIMREPILNRSKIIFRILTNSTIRKRVKAISGHFRSNPEYFGFNIYVGRK